MSSYKIVGSGSQSVVIKPYVMNTLKIFYKNDSESHTTEYVAKIYTEDNKDKFHTELALLQKIAQLQNYTDFTVPIKSAASFDVEEIKHDPEILRNLTSDGKNQLTSNTLYQIVLGYGGINIGSLSKHFPDFKLPFSTFMIIMRDFYQGIQKLQSIGIVHRDLKPTNILLNEMTLYIVDFGMSCDVKDAYSNHPDNMYILSYMYMYNAPEFYIAYLMFQRIENGETFDTSLQKSFDTMANYSKELETFYFEHYHRYNKREPYNVFSYKKGFHDFYELILKKNIKNMSELFTEEMTFKSDIYSTYFILKELRKYIIFSDIPQKHVFNTLCDMTSAINPYKRSNVEQILDYIDDNMFC